MSTEINGLPTADDSELNNQGLHVESGGADLDHVGLEISEEDLELMQAGTQNLVKEGTLTPRQASEELKQIESVRKTFRDLSSEKKKKIISKRVGYGQAMFGSSLPGDIAQVMQLTLQNGVLRNRFCQFVPFFDRAEVNLKIFGETLLGRKNRDDRLNGLSKSASDFYAAAKQARKAAEMRIEQEKEKLDVSGEIYCTPTIPVPCLSTEIHIHTVSSLKHLKAYLELDKLILHCAWLEWNGAMTPNEVREELKPLLDQALTLGRRGYFTFTELMRLRAEKLRDNEVPAKEVLAA